MTSLPPVHEVILGRSAENSQETHSIKASVMANGMERLGSVWHGFLCVVLEAGADG